MDEPLLNLESDAWPQFEAGAMAVKLAESSSTLLETVS